MDIQVKNIKYNLTFSEETTMFQGYLYVDGKRCGFCENHGHGGSTSILPMKEGDRKIIDECEKYCKTLPDVDGLKMDLEFFIDLLIDKHVNTKENKKHFNKGLVIRKGDVVEVITWKGKDFKSMLENSNYWRLLRNEILKVKPLTLHNRLKGNELNH